MIFWLQVIATSADPLQDDATASDFDPQREIKIMYDGESPPKVLDVLDCISEIESLQPAISLSSLTTHYYGNLRFYGLEMPGDIHPRMESLLKKWVVRYKHPDALRALVNEPNLVQELQKTIRELLRSESKSEVLPALSAASSRPELFSADITELEYHPDDEISLCAMRINVECKEEFSTDRNALVLRNLFSKNQANLAVHVLWEYEKSALKLLPAIRERLRRPDITTEQRESVEYALELIWPEGVPTAVRP